MIVNVVADDPDLGEKAAVLARELGTPTGWPPGLPALVLVVTQERLELREVTEDGGDTLWVDLDPAHDSSLLRRAALVNSKDVRRIVDATAGLGRDASVLSAGGAEVILLERSPVIAALLGDGLLRAQAMDDARWHNIRLLIGDALELLPTITDIDVVYLDPMYPVSGREARKAKGMRLLRQHVGDAPDDPLLLETARRSARRRVVVKRPIRAPHFAGVRPSGSLRGKTVRYDLYAPIRDDEVGEAAGSGRTGS